MVIVHDSYLNKDFKQYEPSYGSKGKAFQMDDYGNFRIVVHGFASLWVGYEHIATLEYDDKLYIGVSEYFGGVMPTECVLEVTKTDIVNSEEHPYDDSI